MKSKRIVIFSDSELAIDCHRFFMKYGFEAAFFVLRGKEAEELCGAGVFQLDEVDDSKLVDLECPLIIASSDPAFTSTVKKKLDSLGLDSRHVFDEPLIYSAWLEELVDALSFNRKSTPNEFVAHLLESHPAGLNDASGTAKALAEYPGPLKLTMH